MMGPKIFAKTVGSVRFSLMMVFKKCSRLTNAAMLGGKKNETMELFHM